jgi:hypothetical protein
MRCIIHLFLAMIIVVPAIEAQTSDEVRVDCPIAIQAPSQDTVIDIPVYATNVEDLAGFTLGFRYNSDMVEIDSINAWWSVIPTTIPIPGFPPLLYIVADTANNVILVNWYDSSIDDPITPSQDGYWFTLKMTVKAGIGPTCIDIDSTFVPPAYEFIFSPDAGGQITPNFVDCDSCDIMVGIIGCGDANADGVVNISDAVYLISYIFGGGDPPLLLESGDVDMNGLVNISDAVYMIAYIFGGGPSPCEE